MKYKSHGNWGHGLPDDATHDLNCLACREELDPTNEAAKIALMMRAGDKGRF